MANDLYAEQLRLLQQYRPDLQIEEGARVQLVAALVCPSDEYRQLLEAKALLREYLANHSGQPGIGCDCVTCSQARLLLGERQATLPLELEVPA